MSRLFYTFNVVVGGKKILFTLQNPQIKLIIKFEIALLLLQRATLTRPMLPLYGCPLVLSLIR